MLMVNDLMNTAHSCTVHIPTNSASCGSTRVAPQIEDEPWRVTVDSAGMLCFNSHNGDGTYHTCFSFAPDEKEVKDAIARRRQ
jgi:hypothetical protein